MLLHVCALGQVIDLVDDEPAVAKDLYDGAAMGGCDFAFGTVAVFVSAFEEGKGFTATGAVRCGLDVDCA